jgi:hypothetical protein
MLTMGLLLAGVAAAAAPQPHRSELRKVQVKRAKIVILGAYLSKVEVWAVPTGTGVTESELIGNANRANPAGHNEMWVFPVGCESGGGLLATEVSITAFAEKGDVVGSKSLPYRGLGDLNEALCGKQ